MLDALFDWLEDYGVWILFVLLGAAFVFAITAVVMDARATTACLRAGYPSAKLDWTFNTYCIKRVEQTDVVMPLSEARR